MKKKQIKTYALLILLAAAVVLLAMMPLLAAQEEEASGPRASVLSATVTTGNVGHSLKGGGTLKAGNAVDIKLPADVKIKSFLVRNGDAVSQGDPVAAVDTVSVMNAIVEVQSTMSYLQKQIGNAANDTVSGSIKAAAGGRVKQVFAEPGDSVADVMLEHGALAVLSLDGRMAVTLEVKTDLGAGDSVNVVLADGKEIPGRVESNLNGTLVVSVKDEGYAVDAEVTVTDSLDRTIGTGSLQIHNAWKATGYTGTVSSVYAKAESTVNEGSTLFALKDTGYTGNLEHYSGLHREYEALLQELFAMYESEVITAPCDGIVSGVREDSPFLLDASGEDGWYADPLSTSGDQVPQWTVMLLSSEMPPVCTGTNQDGTCKAQVHTEGCAMYCTGRADCPVFPHKEHDATCLVWCVSAKETGKCTAVNHKADCIEKCSGAAEAGKCPATGVHKPGCIESCISTDGKKDCPATGTHKDDCLERCDKTESCFATVHHYPECLALCTGGEDCPALRHRDGCYMAQLTYVGYAALVRQVGTTELIVAADIQTQYTLKNGKNGLELVSPASVDTKLMLTEQTVAVANPAGFKAGDVVIFWTAYSGETARKTGELVYSRAGSQSGTGSGSIPGMSGLSGLSGLFGGLTAGSFGNMAGGSAAASAQELFPLEGEVLMTVTDHSSLKVTVTIDEQDIAGVKPGQAAEVEVTALKDQVFEAEVTGIGMVGASNGGSSKFSVELTLPWQEDMLEGMNTTAVIPMYTRMEVLTLPVAALAEQSGRTVVFTATDPETGDPAAPVEVETGLSDGQVVEILSGLEKGDTVYYFYYDVLQLDHTAKAESGMFG